MIRGNNEVMNTSDLVSGETITALVMVMMFCVCVQATTAPLPPPLCLQTGSGTRHQPHLFGELETLQLH